ncbi:MAG: helix-turn-helix transcriptional regulator [Thermodesulfobacteriota bacterium]|nr:helix-turn-helix transcriptional regulator [Thermodesulfobacteriota bacterium]
MGLAKNLKRMRKKRGWSQSQLAEQIGLHLSHINRIETGKYNPSLDVIQKLANTFDVTIDYLVSDTEEDFKEVRIEDKSLLDRVKLIDSLDGEDKTALIRVVDSMLTKKKILHLITKENVSKNVG